MVFSRRSAAFTAIAALGIAWVGPSRAEQVLVASLVDDIVYADLTTNGDCVDGCTREEHAIAHVSGTPQTRSCELQTITPFDATTPLPGLLRASIYCEDATGALIEQGTGPCKFEICVDFAWTDGEGDEEGELQYDVVIVREKKPRAPHTVYVDLSVAIDPTATNTAVDSCDKNGTCDTKDCTGTEGYSAMISMTDEYGDGWVGGLPGYYNLWTLVNLANDSIENRGTLADNHDSATIKECLADGDYIFNTTASSAFAEDMGWGVCDSYGKAGEGLKFTVANGACDPETATLIERPTAEESNDASLSYCTLPAPLSADDYRTSTCTALSSGMKIDGVGLYYDHRCTTAGYPGCGARSIAGCRLCFWDKELWLASFPTQRVPDWEDCPCCVANTLGVDCATGGGSSGPDEGVIIGVSVGIAGVIAIACCLSCAFGTTILRFFRRLNKKRNAEMELDLSENAASAFPDSPTAGGGTVRGTGALTSQANRNRGQSGHFPIPRFDSIRGRFDSGIFASNNAGAGAAAYTSSGAGAGGNNSSGGSGAVHAVAYAEGAGGSLEKVVMADGPDPMTAQSTPSGGLAGKGSPGGGAPRSTVLDDRLVAQGFSSSDVGRPVSGALSRVGGGSGGVGAGGAPGAAGWGLAMSGEYPDLEGADPYAIDNVMAVETGTGVQGGRNLE